MCTASCHLGQQRYDHTKVVSHKYCPTEAQTTDTFMDVLPYLVHSPVHGQPNKHSCKCRIIILACTITMFSTKFSIALRLFTVCDYSAQQLLQTEEPQTSYPFQVQTVGHFDSTIQANEKEISDLGKQSRRVMELRCSKQTTIRAESDRLKHGSLNTHLFHP